MSDQTWPSGQHSDAGSSGEDISSNDQRPAGRWLRRYRVVVYGLLVVAVVFGDSDTRWLAGMGLMLSLIGDWNGAIKFSLRLAAIVGYPFALHAWGIPFATWLGGHVSISFAYRFLLSALLLLAGVGLAGWLLARLLRPQQDRWPMLYGVDRAAGLMVGLFVAAVLYAVTLPLTSQANVGSGPLVGGTQRLASLRQHVVDLDLAAAVPAGQDIQELLQTLSDEDKRDVFGKQLAQRLEQDPVLQQYIKELQADAQIQEMARGGSKQDLADHPVIQKMLDDPQVIKRLMELIPELVKQHTRGSSFDYDQDR